MSKFTEKEIVQLLKGMEQITKKLPPTMTAQIIHDYGKNPYLILISCLLSLRSRDAVTYPVSKKLFEHATTPQEMVKLPISQLETVLKPIGFYRRKAQIVHEVSQELLERFDGKVPKTEQELLSIKHVGRKTANLVLSAAFDLPAICVDTHVHRIAHHLHLVNTKTPEATEQALQKIIPKKLWGKINTIFVVWGQHVCKSNSKKCVCAQILE